MQMRGDDLEIISVLLIILGLVILIAGYVGYIMLPILFEDNLVKGYAIFSAVVLVGLYMACFSFAYLYPR